MLKIKDDVDLKELEKFGFKPQYNEDTGKICRYIKPCEFCFGIIKKDTRRFKIFRTGAKWIIDPHDLYSSIDTLYDLIQAGLVEKF